VDARTIIVSAAVGIATSAITAYITTLLKMSEERRKWDRDITLKYAEAAVVNREAAETLARQFAVGFLIVHGPTGQPRSRVFVPKGGRISIGSDPSRCEVVLDDPTVSRVAAMIESDGVSIFVVDLHATNGTSLNGVTLASGSRSKLKSGDEIGIGHSQLTFHGLERID
jgi:pSer/pThr/pTyr-binding forkhead associated (FHA) protein